MGWYTRWSWRLLVLVVALAVAGLALGPAPEPAGALAAPTTRLQAGAAALPAPQVTTLRFGSPQAVSDAGVFIGRTRGYFRQQGIEVEVVPFQSGPDAIPLMATGELDVAGGIVSIALLNAAERGLGVRIVADKGTSRPGFEFSQLGVRRDLLESGAVREPADLRGRRIGLVSLRSGSEAQVATFLARGGLRVQDVELVVISFPDMLLAFANGAIDAANIIEPMLGIARERGLIGDWEPGRSSAAYGGVYQAGVLMYSGRLASQTDLARRFMVAYLQGVRAFNDAFVKGEGRDEVVRILAEQTTLRDPAAYDRIQLAALDPDGRLVRESLRQDLDFLRQQGYYTGTATFDDLIDLSFADYAAQQLGPYR